MTDPDQSNHSKRFEVTRVDAEEPQKERFHGMLELPTPQDIEILAVKAGITVAEACRRAKLVPDVFTRWKREQSSPSIKNLSAIISELDAEIARRAPPQPSTD